MTDYDRIFVVLVYKNADDLKDFVASAEKLGGSQRVVVVNNFSDEASQAAFAQICARHDCDYLTAENKGYGAGNNLGIAYALERYTFRHLIVCNPDTVIRRMPEPLGSGQELEIIGPAILTRTGKRQNPCMVIGSPIREALLRLYARWPGWRPVFYAAIALNKAERLAFLFLFRSSRRPVYALHGSFLIFPKAVLDMLGQPFNPRMFLFREEDYLARLAKGLGIRMIYDPRIQVLHKEDGSMRYALPDVRKHTVESLRVYFGLDQTEK